MQKPSQFSIDVKQILDSIDPQVLAYNKEEFWMIERRYQYVEQYALDHHLTNTAIALPLVRGLHNGTYRKATITKDGVAYRLPYVIHCLMVCRMLIDLQLPMTPEEEDITLAAALCHDVIEDVPLEDGGREMYKLYHLDYRVYETVKYLSKRKDFTEEEHQNYFHDIETHPMALLVKLADRGNNVEDLYNRSVWKIHEYIGETRTYFFPMCAFARQAYPDLVSVIVILQEKMTTLTEIAEILVNRQEAQERAMNEKLTRLREENQRLRGILNSLREAEE